MIPLRPLALSLLPALLPAQDLNSGPVAGSEVREVKAYANLGPNRGKEFDLAKEIGKGPGAILFIQTVNRETAPVMRIFDELGAEHRPFGFGSFLVRLNDDRTAGEEETKRFSNAMHLRNPMVLSLDGAEGPGDYALNRRCTLTLVTMKDGKIVQSIPFTDTGEKDRGILRRAITKVAGALPRAPEKRAELLPDDPKKLKEVLVEQWREIARLRQQLEQLQNRNRQRRNRGPQNPRPLPGAVPEDAALQGLMREFTRVKTTDEVDAYFRRVDEVIGQDPKRREGMTQAFVRLLATTYGTDYAREKAKSYVGERRDARPTSRPKKDL